MSRRPGKLLHVIAACAVLGALAPAAWAESVGGWVMKAPLPAALDEVAVAYVDGKVHVMGGTVLGFNGPYHVAYDPATDKWSVRAPLPRSLDHIGAAVLGGK